MKIKEKKLVLILAASLIFITTSCKANDGVEPTNDGAEIANPASEFCLNKGYRHELITEEDGSQRANCIFPDGSSCDEWAYFRGECQPSSEDMSADGATPTSVSETLPAVPTINPEEYDTWMTYAHSIYGFSFKLPQDWIVREDTSGGVLSGHLLTILPENEGDGRDIRLTFREIGDDTLLWPTGVGEGEFIDQGSLQIGNTEVSRKLLVCPSGEITSIWYQGSDNTPYIHLGDLEFGIIYHASASHCTAGNSLEGKNQLVGEMIIASLNIP